MTLKTVPVTGILYNPGGSVSVGTSVVATLTVMDTDGGVVVPSQVSTTTASDGSFTLNLWPNARGVNGSQYRVRSNVPGALPGVLLLNVLITVPDSDPATPVPISIITNRRGPDVLSDAIAAMLAAQAFALQAMLAETAVAYIYPTPYATAPTKRPDGTAIQAGDCYLNSTDGYGYRYVNGAWASSDKNAATSATASAASAASAAHIYGGTYATAPLTRPDGTAIQAGDIYFNSTSNAPYIYNAGVWQLVPSASAADLASSTDQAKGASLIGYDGASLQAVADYAKPLQDYTALRAYTGRASAVRITGVLATVNPQGIAGLFIRTDSDTTSTDNGGTVIVDANGRRWKREVGSSFRPEWFGAKGDGATDDGAALASTCAVINAQGGGTLELRPGAVYMVGGQTMQNPPLYTNFTWPPNVLYPIEFANCTKTVVLRGNGAVIRCLPNAKYGVFNTDGTPKTVSPGYVGVGASTPYYYMVYAHGCKEVHLENVELDGNLNNLNVNGYFSDSGIQIQATGYWLQNNAGPVTVDNVYTHHHGLDGYSADGPSTGATFTKECGVITGVRSECNGRNAMSFVGGKGWTFIGCSFNYSGKANVGSDTLGKVTSNPCAGIDFEAEAGKEIRDVYFINCEYVANANQGVVSDSGTNTDRVHFKDCTFIGTTNYSLWPNRPGFKFERCRLIGTVTTMWNGTSSPPSPADAVEFRDCYFTNDPAASPTGKTYTVNSLLIEGGSGYVNFRKCKFVHAISGTGTNGNYDGPIFDNCEFVATAGALGMSGRYTNKCFFHENGGLMQYIPGAPNSGPPVFSGKTNGGSSESVWYFRSGGVTTEYQATIDPGTSEALGSRTTGIDANLTLTAGTDYKLQILNGTITANRTITLATGVKTQCRFRIVRTGGGAFSWSVMQGGTLLKTLTAANQWAEFEFANQTSGWALTAYGSL